MAFGTPLPFFVQSVEALEPGDALDVACGKGRHGSWLERKGWRVVCVDIDQERLNEVARVAPHAMRVLRDVEQDGLPASMSGSFDLVVTTFFLFRPLIPDLYRVLRPAGQWILETFQVENHLRQGHPRRRKLCLEDGEARSLAEKAGFEVVSLVEGLHDGVWTTRLVATKPR
jgi:SAM-dependent methyltransferase